MFRWKLLWISYLIKINDENKYRVWYSRDYKNRLSVRQVLLKVRSQDNFITWYFDEIVTIRKENDAESVKVSLDDWWVSWGTGSLIPWTRKFRWNLYPCRENLNLKNDIYGYFYCKTFDFYRESNDQLICSRMTASAKMLTAILEQISFTIDSR